MKNKKATINRNNNDDKCFKYAIIAVLNHEKIKNHPERNSDLESFIGEYEWKILIFRQLQKTGKSFNKTITQLLLISYLYHTILNK